MSVLVAERERLASYVARSAAALTEIVGSVAGVSLVWANDVFAPASDVAIRSARQAFLLSFIGYERKNGRRIGFGRHEKGRGVRPAACNISKY
ncbi:hypothetical protein [Burkholderia ubonensis]|uniref:hypothetical protein n=1 Tax=Burkholderia ubonensis TaxID=101571 RepID=UPI001E5879DB|nr:hypothetical protein [Burkholderia ubonensis]